MTEDRVRVLRVLEYEGPRSWVEYTLAQNAVKGEKRFTKGDELHIIREAMIGEMPVILRNEKVPVTKVQYDSDCSGDPKRMYHYSWCAKHPRWEHQNSCTCDNTPSW
jgi:hypothetical protein